MNCSREQKLFAEQVPAPQLAGCAQARPEPGFPFDVGC